LTSDVHGSTGRRRLSKTFLSGCSIGRVPSYLGMRPRVDRTGANQLNLARLRHRFGLIGHIGFGFLRRARTKKFWIFDRNNRRPVQSGPLLLNGHRNRV